MKDRYYSICRKLVRSRPWAGDDASKSQLLSSFQFDKGTFCPCIFFSRLPLSPRILTEREVTRKKYVASLESRTPEQIAEEEALYIELKRLEQTERKFKRDRDELLRTLLGIESGLPDINASDEDGLNMSASGGGLSISVGGLSVDTSNKKRKKGGEVDTPVSATSASANVIQFGQSSQKKSAKSAAYGTYVSSSPSRHTSEWYSDALHCIVRTDVPASSTSNKAAHTPVYLRTYKVPTPKSALAPKIASLMAELQINHTRLVMPTRENNIQLEGLLEAAAALIETKKLVDKVDMDLRVAKARLGGGGEGGSGEGSVGGGDNEMEMDEDAEGEQEEGIDGSGRGQSVVSTRSGRGRKQVCLCSALSIFMADSCCALASSVYVDIIRGHCCHREQEEEAVTVIHRIFHCTIDNGIAAVSYDTRAESPTL